MFRAPNFSPLQLQPVVQKLQDCPKKHRVHYRHRTQRDLQECTGLRAADRRELLQDQKKRGLNAPNQRHRTRQASPSFSYPGNEQRKKRGRMLIGDGHKILQTFIMSNNFIKMQPSNPISPIQKNYSFPAGKAVPHNRQQDTCHLGLPLWRLRSI